MMPTLKYQRRLLFEFHFVDRCKIILLRLGIVSGEHANFVFDTLKYFVEPCRQINFFVFLVGDFTSLKLFVLGRSGDRQYFLLIIFLVL